MPPEKAMFIKPHARRVLGIVLQHGQMPLASGCRGVSGTLERMRQGLCLGLPLGIITPGWVLHMVQVAARN